MGKLAVDGSAVAIAPVPIDAVWAVVTDPTRLGDWSLEVNDADWTGRWNSAEMGARFIGAVRVGRLNSDRTGEVVELDPPFAYGWRTIPTIAYPESTLWRVVLEPASEGTLIELSFESLRMNPMLDRLMFRFAPQRRERASNLAIELSRLVGLVSG